MKRLILTGFEPFGPYQYNPTKDAATTFDRVKVGDVEVIGLVLPCTYYGGFQTLSQKIDELSPDLILSSGLASRVQAIRIESVGRNVMHSKYADADGRMPDEDPIVRGALKSYRTTADSVRLADRLKEAGIPSEVSDDAESFICNSLIYLTAKRITDERLPIRFGFFHTPWTREYLDRVQLEEGNIAISGSDLRKAIEVMVVTLGRASESLPME